MSTIFSEALISALPHDAIPPGQRIFEPFIGSWDLVVSWYGPDGSLERRQDGEWHFERVLEGRGIQDVWIVPPRSQRPAASGDYEYGTSLRFYDPTIEAWRSTWIGPQHHVVYSFIARRVVRVLAGHGIFAVSQRPAAHSAAGLAPAAAVTS